MNNRLIALFAAPLVVIFGSVVLFSLIKFKPQIAGDPGRPIVLYEKISFIKREPVAVTTIESPIRITRIPLKKDFPPVPLSEVAPQPVKSEERKVSLIVINGGRKLAIINGIVVREGDITGGARVLSIEKGRVLLKDKFREEWVKLE